MTITRAQVESVLIRRAGKLMTAANLDGTTHSGVNADLNDPIGYALRWMEYSVTTISNVVDADLAKMADADVDELLDMAEYRLFQNIEGNLDSVDITANSRSESLNQLVVRVRAKLDELKRRAENLYGLGAGTLTAGAISLDFMETSEDSE